MTFIEIKPIKCFPLFSFICKSSLNGDLLCLSFVKMLECDSGCWNVRESQSNSSSASER